MNEEVNELISYYNSEKANIEELLKECLQFSDYEYASLFQKSLGIVNNKLSILNSLIDPNHLKKKELENSIQHYHKLILTSPQISDYLSEKIKHFETDLDHLKHHSLSPFFDGQEFDDAVFSLIEHKISSFVFHLRRSDNLYIHFSIKKNKIKISLTPFNDLSNKYYLVKPTLDQLRQIGFKKNKSKTCLHMKFSLDDFKDAIAIKTLISRVIYDALFFYDLDKLTTLEIRY